MENKIYLGAAYYPEQWPEHRWETDAELMKEVGISVVRLAEFSWSLIEPDDGRFDFSLFDRAIEVLYKKGIQIVMCTPTMTPPMWMCNRYPSLVVKNRDRLPSGQRGSYCNNNPDYRRFSERIVKKMAEHYKDNPAVIAWQIDNEFNAPRCYCENCTREFRNWLKERYKTLQNLNEAWGNVFWSQIYNEWNEIEVPHNGEMITQNTSKILDYYRFISDSTIRYQSLQVEILKEIAPYQSITHNGMGQFDKVNYHDLGKDLDFYSFDSYPAVDCDNANLCLNHDLSRGVKQKNYWVMEQKNGYFNYASYNLAIEPGLVRLWSYRGIARGANGIVFFRWRSGRYGTEQHPQGLLRHDGSKRRSFFEVKQLSEELKNIGADLAVSQFCADTAMLWSYDQIWAFETQVQNSDFDYKKHFLSYYKALLNLGIPTDIINPMRDLRKYKMVIAPALFLINKEIADNLINYVSQGGTLVLTIRTGIKEWSNITTELPWPGLLHELSGTTVLEFDSLPSHMKNRIEYKNKHYEVRAFLEILEAWHAKAIAVYEEKFYKGQPAVTENKYGKGKVVYIGVMAEERFYSDILGDLAASCGLKANNWPKGIEVTYRQAKDCIYMFLINGTFEKKIVQLDGDYKDIITGENVSGKIELEKLDVLVLKQ